MKKVGILGGMGPLATVDLFEKIVLVTDAKKDQDHIPLIINNIPQITDRTQAILHKGKSPYPTLVTEAKKLQGMGAEILAIACNTSYYYYDDLKKELDIPILHMQKIVAKKLTHCSYKMPAILATKGALEVGLYQKALKEEGLQYLEPKEDQKDIIQDLIYQAIKGKNFHYPQEKIEEVFLDLKGQGADCFILGCTELPLAKKIFHWKETCIDPTLEMAKEIVIQAGGSLDGKMETL